jgi:hypothetical protein
MSVCGQSLSGQDLQRFKNLLNKVDRVKRASLEKKLAAIVQRAIDGSMDNNLSDAIANGVKKLLAQA